MQDLVAHLGTRYIGVKFIGQGAFGKAILARSSDPSDSTLKVVKVVQGHLDPESHGAKEALKEVRILKALSHPNIIKYIDSYQLHGNLYIVTDYCEGGDMAKLISDHRSRGKYIEEDLILSWLVQLCFALKYVHSKKILHRDIKTQNIFLTRNNTVAKLGDFGISRVLTNTLENAMSVVGTPTYVSPEIVQKKPYNHKTDIWSLGCVIYEAASLHFAFQAHNMTALLLKIVRGMYPPLPGRYSKEFNEVTAAMLRKSPDRRPSAEGVIKMPVIHNRIHGLISNTLKKNEGIMDAAVDQVQKKLEGERLPARKVTPMQRATPMKKTTPIKKSITPPPANDLRSKPSAASSPSASPQQPRKPTNLQVPNNPSSPRSISNQNNLKNDNQKLSPPKGAPGVERKITPALQSPNFIAVAHISPPKPSVPSPSQPQSVLPIVSPHQSPMQQRGAIQQQRNNREAAPLHAQPSSSPSAVTPKQGSPAPSTSGPKSSVSPTPSITKQSTPAPHTVAASPQVHAGVKQAGTPPMQKKTNTPPPSSQQKQPIAKDFAKEIEPAKGSAKLAKSGSKPNLNIYNDAVEANNINKRTKEEERKRLRDEAELEKERQYEAAEMDRIEKLILAREKQLQHQVYGRHSNPIDGDDEVTSVNAKGVKISEVPAASASPAAFMPASKIPEPSPAASMTSHASSQSDVPDKVVSSPAPSIPVPSIAVDAAACNDISDATKHPQSPVGVQRHVKVEDRRNDEYIRVSIAQMPPYKAVQIKISNRKANLNMSSDIDSSASQKDDEAAKIRILRKELRDQKKNISRHDKDEPDEVQQGQIVRRGALENLQGKLSHLKVGKPDKPLAWVASASSTSSLSSSSTTPLSAAEVSGNDAIKVNNKDNILLCHPVNHASDESLTTENDAKNIVITTIRKSALSSRLAAGNQNDEDYIGNSNDTAMIEKRNETEIGDKLESEIDGTIYENEKPSQDQNEDEKIVLSDAIEATDSQYQAMDGKDHCLQHASSESASQNATAIRNIGHSSNSQLKVSNEQPQESNFLTSATARVTAWASNIPNAWAPGLKLSSTMPKALDDTSISSTAAIKSKNHQQSTSTPAKGKIAANESMKTALQWNETVYEDVLQQNDDELVEQMNAEYDDELEKYQGKENYDEKEFRSETIEQEEHAQRVPHDAISQEDQEISTIAGAESDQDIFHDPLDSEDMDAIESCNLSDSQEEDAEDEEEEDYHVDNNNGMSDLAFETSREIDISTESDGRNIMVSSAEMKRLEAAHANKMILRDQKDIQDVLDNFYAALNEAQLAFIERRNAKDQVDFEDELLDRQQRQIKQSSSNQQEQQPQQPQQQDQKRKIWEPTSLDDQKANDDESMGIADTNGEDPYAFHRIEELRVALENMLGLDRFMEVYRIALNMTAEDDDIAISHAIDGLLGDKKEALELLMQLVALEEREFQ